MALDLQKHNSQYTPIELKTIKTFHDRFIIIDDNEVYHFGASLKDLALKCFAFSKLDVNYFELLNKLKWTMRLWYFAAFFVYGFKGWIIWIELAMV